MTVILYFLGSILYFLIRYSIIKYQIRKYGKCFMLTTWCDTENFLGEYDKYDILHNKTIEAILFYSLIWPVVTVTSVIELSIIGIFVLGKKLSENIAETVEREL